MTFEFSFQNLVLLGQLLFFPIHVDIFIQTVACMVSSCFSAIEALSSVIGGFPLEFPDSWSGFLHSNEPQSHKYLSTYASFATKVDVCASGEDYSDA
jgi:hypothetical protein